MEVQDIRCPLCGQIDSVQKVSSIVHNGMSYGETSGAARGAYVTMYSKNQTVLSEQLAIPDLNLERPNQLRSEGLLFFVLGLLWAPFGSYELGAIWGGHTNFYFAIIIYGPVLLSLPFLVSGFALRRVIISKDAPKRARAKEIWERLYYCHRDDVAFTPGSAPDRCIPASKVKAFLGY